MSDVLLNLGRNAAARSVLSTIGVTVPPQLRRASGPWVERPLEARNATVGGGPLVQALSRQVLDAGANLVDDGPVHALVFDASSLASAADLRALYDFFHPRLSGLGRNGRVVVLGRPPSSQAGVEASAAVSALDGFTRSVAKEIGRKGATANLIRVEPGAEDRIEPALRFLLSDRSVYVDGQPLDVTALCSGEPSPFTPSPLAGRTALVTGAARGIGAATARRLAEEGAHVHLLDRPDDALSALAAEIGGTPLPLDVTDPKAPARIAEALSGGVHAVVHNAGITHDKTLGRMPPESWDLLLDINFGAIMRIHEALAAGPLQDGGRVVLLSSIAGLAGNVGQTNYAASKAAVAGLARRLAVDLAPRGIGVSAVAPGFIETRMTAAIPFVTREAARRLANLSQGGQPQDVADVLTFLCSPGALGLSGTVLRVCGGSLVGA